MMDQYNWFSVKHIPTNKVISSCDTPKEDVLIKSQVIITKPQHTDNELWRWNGQHLENKSTGLVLDIREGKLRAIEDTEICLCYKNPPESAHNQLWAVRAQSTQEEHLLTRRPSQIDLVGKTIYSVCSSDWVLDVCPNGQKVILFPQDPLDTGLQQRWEFIPQKVTMPIECALSDDPGLMFEDQIAMAADDYYIYPSSRNSSISTTCESIGFAHGLTPARRNSSRSSFSSNRKDSLDELPRYHELNNHH